MPDLVSTPVSLDLGPKTRDYQVYIQNRRGAVDLFHFIIIRKYFLKLSAVQRELRVLLCLCIPIDVRLPYLLTSGEYGNSKSQVI